MTEESVVVICPNPKCGKEIREPMLLTILCVTPPEQYEACPYCFAKLQPEDYPQETEAPELEQEEETELEEEAEPEELDDESDDEDEEDEEDFETDESDDYEEDEAELEDILPESDVQENFKESAPSFLQRVKSLIPSSNESKKEKADARDFVSAVEPEEELEDEDEEDSYEEEDEFETDESDDESDEETEEDLETDEPEDDEEEENEPEEEEPKAKQSVNTESKKEGCPEVFGYLANREKGVPIPAVCYMCPRMVDCMLSPRDY